MFQSFAEFSGYSLLEQMTVLAIMMVVLMSSAPLLNETWQTQQNRSVIKRLQTAIDTGRQLSLLTHQRIVLKAGNIGLSSDSNWTSGWLLTDGEGHVIRQYHGPHQGKLVWHGSFGDNSQLSYHVDGTLEQQGHFCYCNHSQSCLGLAVNRSGSYTIFVNNCIDSSTDA